MTDRRGWAWPANSRKAHYFDGFRSLCGRWGYNGTLRNDNPGERSVDDCAECRRQLGGQK